MCFTYSFEGNKSYSKCHLNHEGSTSSMESAAAVVVFSRSFKNYGLRYTKYYGYVDSLSFSMVENIYQSTKIVKYERVGNRLRKLCQRVKGLGGKDKTTEVVRQTLGGNQGYEKGKRKAN